MDPCEDVQALAQYVFLARRIGEAVEPLRGARLMTRSYVLVTHTRRIMHTWSGHDRGIVLRAGGPTVCAVQCVPKRHRGGSPLQCCERERGTGQRVARFCHVSTWRIHDGSKASLIESCKFFEPDHRNGCLD
jgi:hypothetical protein